MSAADVRLRERGVQAAAQPGGRQYTETAKIVSGPMGQRRTCGFSWTEPWVENHPTLPSGSVRDGSVYRMNSISA